LIASIGARTQLRQFPDKRGESAHLRCSCRNGGFRSQSCCAQNLPAMKTSILTGILALALLQIFTTSARALRHYEIEDHWGSCGWIEHPSNTKQVHRPGATAPPASSEKNQCPAGDSSSPTSPLIGGSNTEAEASFPPRATAPSALSEKDQSSTGSSPSPTPRLIGASSTEAEASN